MVVKRCVWANAQKASCSCVYQDLHTVRSGPPSSMAPSPVLRIRSIPNRDPPDPLSLVTGSGANHDRASADASLARTGRPFFLTKRSDPSIYFSSFFLPFSIIRLRVSKDCLLSFLVHRSDLLQSRYHIPKAKSVLCHSGKVLVHPSFRSLRGPA